MKQLKYYPAAYMVFFLTGHNRGTIAMYIGRHEQILQLLASEQELSVTALSDRTQVSEVTIRKDLTFLEHEGCLKRTRGGARISENYRPMRSMRIRQQQQRFVKQAIAKKAAELVEPDEVIFIDAGSTCQLIARHIVSKDLLAITNSIDVISSLCLSEHVSVCILGGNLRKRTGAMIGPSAVRSLEQYRITTCFIGATGFDHEGRFSSSNTLESELKHQVLLQSKRRVIVSDSTKYLSQAYSIFAQPEEVDLLITDSGFPEAEQYHSMGITTLMVT